MGSVPADPADAHLCALQALHSRHVRAAGPRAYRPAQRRFHVRPHHLVSRVSAFGLGFTEPGDPALREADADVYFVGLEGCDHVACAGGEGDEGAW